MEYQEKNSFIMGEYIPHELCDELLNYFNYNKKYLQKGIVGQEDPQVDKDIKDSIELNISPGNFDGVIGEYRKNLDKITQLYIKKYEPCIDTEKWGLFTNYNFQKYEIGGGFKKWHFENQGYSSCVRRHLVFMTYLNDVEDGGTEFYYQNLKTKAEKGLTLLWPAGFTHTHRGIISQTKEKYIITGWYSFRRNRDD
jgi:hypothetical protein